MEGREEDFFRLTPWQSLVSMKARGKAKELEAKMRAIQAWQTEAFARTKNLRQALDRIKASGSRKPKKPLDGDQMVRILKAKFGVKDGV